MSGHALECGVTTSAQFAAACESDRLLRASPSMAGVDGDAIIAFLDEVEAADLELHSMMLWRNGRVVAEAWRWPYRPDRPRILHSVAKSFTASAIGLALADNLFQLDEKVVAFFPDLFAGPVEGWLGDMTIEDLLTMRVGHASETSGAVWRALETSWTAEFFKIPIVQKPGTVFMYTSAASYILSAILSRLTGETLHDYLKPRLFEPLGIKDESWDIGPDGINPGGNGLCAKTVDLLKLGVLHQQDGIWEGKRLLPEGWVAKATAPHGDPIEYGYHWWTRPDGSFSAIGRFVQMATSFPAHGATLAVTGAIKGSRHLFPIIDRHFPAAFREGLTDGAAADQRLAARLADWQRADAPASWKAPFSGARGAGAPLSQRYQMDANAHGVDTIELQIADDECVFRLTDATGVHVIVAGFDKWLESRTDMPGRELHHGYSLCDSPVVARACWIEEGSRLQMTWIFPETAFRDTVTCEFSERRITLKRTVNINGGALCHADIVGVLTG